MLTKKVKSYILTQKLLNKGDHVLVGVSGGPDSVALLVVLHKLRHELAIKLSVGHFNHRLRKTADKEEVFVVKLCKDLNVACHSKQWINLRRKKTVSEEKSRKARYEFLTSLAKKIHAQSIAVGHTNDDLAETVLLRMIRGSGLQGLRSILPKRPINGTTVIRPFLSLSKKEILEFLAKQKIRHCIDTTNRDVKFLRNKVRRRLLPLLAKDYNKNIKRVLGRLAQNTELDYNYIRQASEEIYKKISSSQNTKIVFDSTLFLKQHKAVQRYLVRLAYENLKGNTNKLDFEHIEKIENLIEEGPFKAVLNLPSAIKFLKEKGHFVVYK